MRLDVSKALVSEGEGFPFNVEVSLPPASLLGEPVEYAIPAKLRGFCTSVGNEIHLRGEMSFVAKSRCVLCLKDADKAFSTSFDAAFSLAPDPKNPDLYVYDGAWVDPLDMAADAALLALPMQWRCADDCMGLCPVCGVDRNVISCSCRMEMQSKHPFSALQQLLTEDESEV